MHKGVNIWQLSVFQGSSSFATSWAFSILLVCGEVERDEENQVRTDYAHTSESSEFFTGAVSSVWHPWEVGGGEVSVGGEVNEDYQY